MAIGPLVVLAAVTLSAVTWLSAREVDRRVSSDSRSTSATVGAWITSERHHLELQTRLLAEMPYVRAAAMTGDQRTAQDRIDAYGRFVDSDGLLLINSTSHVWAGSGPMAAPLGRPISEFDTDSVLNGNSWSGVESTSGGLVLAASTPIELNGYAQGALVAYRVIDSGRMKWISDQVGIPVAFTVRGRVAGSSLPIVGRRLAETGRVTAKVGDAELVGKWAPLAGTAVNQNLGFVALRPIDEIVAPSSELLRALLVVLVVTIAATAALAGRLAGVLAKPLMTVVRAAKEIESGLWPGSLALSNIHEVAVLQTGFNRMTQAVKEHQEKLQAMVDLDPLTELPNHRRFKESLAHAIVREHVKSRPVSVLLFDLDHFDDYNRRHGLARGDEMIKLFAGIAARHSTEGALVARYGGDEFAVLLPGVVPDEAWGISEEIRQRFNAMAGNGLTVSGGLANVTPTTDRAESLSLAAELAVTKAKQLGRNQVCKFESLIGEKGSDPYELNRFLENATLSTVQALAAAVDAKDTYTQGHSQRVAQYASGLCRFVGGSDAEVELVYRTGTLHDVGKIGIPDHVLKKAGPLTQEERAIMETHPALGEVIVAKVPYLQDTLSGVRHHHERWDGKGYPDGLAGESISRLARMLALADTYDAMTSDRPYRKGLSIETALAEVEKNAGTQFDPVLAAEFVRFMRKHLGTEKLAA